MALLAAVGCLAISSTASAGPYLGLSLGTSPSMDGKIGSVDADSSGRSLRGLIGMRFMNISAEGALNGFDVATTNYGEHTAYQLSAAVKVSMPIALGFEGFARGGLERTWLSMGNDDLDFSGNGFLLGIGFEYRLDVILASASVFVDYDYHRVTLSNASDSSGENIGVWALGFTFGI